MLSLQDNAWIDEAVEKIVKKMDLVSERSRNKIPYTAQNGVHDDRSREDQTFSADAELVVQRILGGHALADVPCGGK